MPPCERVFDITGYISHGLINGSHCHMIRIWDDRKCVEKVMLSDWRTICIVVTHRNFLFLCGILFCYGFICACRAGPLNALLGLELVCDTIFVIHGCNLSLYLSCEHPDTLENTFLQRCNQSAAGMACALPLEQFHKAVRLTNYSEPCCDKSTRFSFVCPQLTRNLSDSSKFALTILFVSCVIFAFWSTTSFPGRCVFFAFFFPSEGILDNAFVAVSFVRHWVANCDYIQMEHSSCVCDGIIGKIKCEHEVNSGLTVSVAAVVLCSRGCSLFGSTTT